MKQIFYILQGLRELSGNAQIAYLLENKSDLLEEILEYTYNPHKKYKIEEGKFEKFYNEIYTSRQFSEDDWKIFKYSILDHLSNIKSAKDDDIKDVVNYFHNFSLESQNFMKMILFKDLRLNMSIKKFQKVWPGFCEEPQVQLAMNKDDREEFSNCFYSRKFDGKRMYIKEGKPFSRTNKECSIPPVKHILDQISTIDEIKNYFVLDGECLYFEKGRENFQKGISLCQRDERMFGCDNICYVIFDMIPKNKFLTKEPFESFEMEYNRMIDFLSDETKDSPCYSLIPTILDNIYIARQDKDKTKLAKLCIENNWEGLMLRDGDSTYEYKRTNKLLKIKSMADIEVKLVDMEEGTGKHTGRLGAFIADYKGYKLKIGSGFSDEQREEYWNNKDKYIGEWVKVQYFEKTTNLSGEESLRFPIFLCFRNIQTKEEFLIK